MGTDVSQEQISEGRDLIERGKNLISEKQMELMSTVMGDTGAPTLHNFQGDNMQVWKQISKVSSAECTGFDDIGDEGVELHNFYVHQVEFEEATGGELSQGIRTVLIPKEGKPFACVSDGIAKDLFEIIHTFGFGPYDPPIQVKPVAVKTRKGRKTYRLVPVD